MNLRVTLAAAAIPVGVAPYDLAFDRFKKLVEPRVELSHPFIGCSRKFIRHVRAFIGTHL